MATVKLFISLLAAIISIIGCDNHEARSSRPVDSPTRIDDVLNAPTQPRLFIEATPETLVLSWESRLDQLANIYEYNTSTGEESLIVGDVSGETTTASIPSKTPERTWHFQQMRLELCDPQDCISSEKIAINALVGPTSHTLRPAVFLQGERFAESVTTNYNASLIASTLPVEGAVQVHFHNRKQWIATSPIRLDLTDLNTLLDISSSGTGDTLAVLIRSDSRIGQAGRIAILERLGETWFPVSTVSVPTGTVLDLKSHLTLSTTGDQLYLLTSDKLLMYYRGDLDWSPHPSIATPSGSSLAAAYIDSDLNQIKALIRQTSGLWLVSYQRDDVPNGPIWLESNRQLVHGVDAEDDVFLQGNVDGSSLLIAGWGTALEERSPVLWRFQSDDESRLTVTDTLRMAPAGDVSAELRFSSSKDLETVALGWHSAVGDDAQLSTFTFGEYEQAYQIALELPAHLPTLAKQSFARDVVLSDDGETLLISTLPGNATPSTNRAGELLILR